MTAKKTARKPIHRKAPEPTPKSIFDEAKAIIEGDREQVYGPPGTNLETIAHFWTTYLQRKLVVQGSACSVTAKDVCQMMILMKQARLLNSPDHHDSQLDILGYGGLMSKV